MPLTVLKLKGKKMFSVTLRMFRWTLCHLTASCTFYFLFHSYCDITQAQSYIASIILAQGGLHLPPLALIG